MTEDLEQKFMKDVKELEWALHKAEIALRRGNAEGGVMTDDILNHVLESNKEAQTMLDQFVTDWARVMILDQDVDKFVADAAGILYTTRMMAKLIFEGKIRLMENDE